jgi:hypothetical protein
MYHVRGQHTKFLGVPFIIMLVEADFNIEETLLFL